jgi:hypothetical protein
VGAPKWLYVVGALFACIVLVGLAGRDSSPAASSSSTDSANSAKAAAAASPRPTATQRPPPTVVVGDSRNNPAPMQRGIEVGEYLVGVNGVRRPADSIVEAGNMFNQDAEAGYEYIQVFVTVGCMRQASAKCNVMPYQFEIIGSDGIVHEPAIVVGVDGMLETVEFYGGAMVEQKSLFFRIPKNDLQPILKFKAGLVFGDDAFIYLGS